MSTRILRAAAAATLLLVIGASAVTAGGWATIVADDGASSEPRAGEDIEYGFTVMQHGVTPADFEDPTLRLTNTLTGETFDVHAAASGAPGHFVARFSFPSGGSWSYGVQLRQLAVETQPVTALVLEADGSRPVADVGQALAAVEQAKADIAASIRSELMPKIDVLEQNVAGLREQSANLRAELREIAASAPTTEGATDASPAPNDIPPLGVVVLAILGGALSGFAMAWLGQRREPTSLEGEPAPSGRPVTT